MTPPAKTLMGSKINYFQGSIALCHTGSIARGFSSDYKLTLKMPNQGANIRFSLDYLAISEIFTNFA